MYEDLVKQLRELEDDFMCVEDGFPVASVLSDAADAIEELFGKVEQLPRWIPVTERLPEPHTRVIGFMAWKKITAIEYQNGMWYSIDHLEPLPDEAVTHWMPLPEPPKEEE